MHSLYTALFAYLLNCVSAFTLPQKRAKVISQRNLFFFGILDSKNDAKDKDNSKKSDNQSPSNMGKTANTMESFKKSQELGKKTAALLQELSNSSIEGSSAKGRVKILVDGQQLPLGVDIDEEYFQSISLEDLMEDLTAAMQDAHEKSTKLMSDKMQSLYKDLGLPSTVSP